MKIVIIFLFFSFFYLSSQSQIIYNANSDEKNSVRVLSQKEIDLISNPADGYYILNSDTKCINYFFSGSWYELCGTCLPKPQKPLVDSVVYYLNSALIYLNTQTNSTFSVLENNILKQDLKSPIYLSNIGSKSFSNISIFSSNSCGLSQPVVLELKNNILFEDDKKPFNDTINNLTYSYVRIGNLYWITQDIQTKKDRKNTFISDNDVYFNYKAAEQVCPSSWRLPTDLEVKNLLSIIPNVDSSFTKTIISSKLNFSFSGVVEPVSKKVFSKGTNHYIWTSGDAKNGNKIFVNIGKSGFLIMDADKNSLMNVRCVKEVTN